MTENNSNLTVNSTVNSTVLDTIDISGIMGMAMSLIKNINIDTLYKKIDTKILHSQFIDQVNMDDPSKLMMDIEAVPDPTKSYICTEKKAICKGSSMTKLHKWVLMTKEYPFLEDKIKEYCQNHPEDIDKFTENRNFTPLMLSVLNLDSASTFRTIQILLEAGSNPNIECPDDKETLLTLISDKSKLARLDLYKLLLNYKANVTYDRSAGLLQKTIIENFISCCPPDNQEANKIIDILVENGADLSTVQNENILINYYLCKLRELQRENESLKQYVKLHYSDPVTIKI